MIRPFVPKSGLGGAHAFLSNLDLTFARPKPARQEFDRRSNLIWLPQSTLPHCGHAPSAFQKRCANGTVPSNVGLKLRLPELRASRWAGGVATALVPMPEAAVYEDHGMMFRKNDVRPSVNLAGMNPEAKAARMQRPPEKQFGLCVLSSDPGHHPGASLLVHDIGHVRPGFRSSTWYTLAE